MEIINTVMEQINEHRGSRSSQILASALASACNSRYGVSLLDVSVSLDRQSKALVQRLSNISSEGDFSNLAQDRALRWLRDNQFID